MARSKEAIEISRTIEAYKAGKANAPELEFGISRAAIGFTQNRAEGNTGDDTGGGVQDEITFPVDFIISTEDEDSHGTVMLNSAWNLDEFNSNPIVTHMHPYLSSEDPDVFIGLGPARNEGGKIIAAFTPEPGDTNQVAVKVTNKIKTGIYKSASIYAYATDGEWGDKLGKDPDLFYFTKLILRTWGVVAFPSNKACRIVTKSTSQDSKARSLKNKAKGLLLQISIHKHKSKS